MTQTGEATYAIPIFTPPGTNGMQPQLAIKYGHRNGGQLLGAGWSLAGLSIITRCSRTWAQDGGPRTVRNDYTDRFCLDGKKLRLVAGTYGQAGAEYRTEIETYSRIYSVGPAAGNGPSSFTVETKDGLIYEYGNTDDSRIESFGQATVRAWAVNKVRDRAGNAMLFNYTEDTANGSFRINDIQYTSNTTQGLSPAYTVSFLYELRPGDEVLAGYLAGSAILEYRRLDRIDVSYSSTLVRRYELTYEGSLSSAGRSRLASVQECGGSSGTDCFPATTFAYQNGTSGLGSHVSTGYSVPAAYWVMDVSGDGRDDVVYSSSVGSGTWKVMIASASGGYNAPIDTGIANTNYGGAIPIDYNADGKQDLLVPYSGGTWWVMIGSASGLATPVNTGTAAVTTGNDAVAADIDGDGVEDLVWAEVSVFSAPGDVIRYRRRELAGTFSSTVTNLVGPMPDEWYINPGLATQYGRRAKNRLPDLDGDGRKDIFYASTNIDYDEESQQSTITNYWNFNITGGSNTWSIVPPASPRPIFADLNGDGRSDYIAGEGSFFNWWGTGTTVTPGLSFGSTTGYNIGQTVIVDWDSDGREDFLVPYTPSGTWHLFRSTGNGVASAVNTGLSLSSAAGPTSTDVNGDGLTDIAYVSGGVWAYRLHSGTEPDLLQTATDGYGNYVTFNYAPLPSANYTKYSDAVYPAQDYQGPMSVVNSATSSNGIGGTYTNTFHYYGARKNLQGRGLEGFYFKRSHDSRNGLVQYEYFNRAFPYTGTTYQVDLFQPDDATLITRTHNAFNVHAYGAGYEARQHPYVQTTTLYSHEVGGTLNGLQTRSSVTNHSVDYATGTLFDSTTTVTEPASAGGVQSGASYVARTYHSSLFNDYTNWCFGRPSVTQQINSHNQYGGTQQTRRVDTTWTGAMCRPTQTQVQPGDGTMQVTTDLAYDGFGNVNSETITGVGMSARTTTASWGTTGQFLVSITRPVSASFSETSQQAWNYGHGVPSSQTDPNNITVSWVHDNFGRVTRENRPDGTATDFDRAPCNAGNNFCGDSRLRSVVTTTLRDNTNQLLRNDLQYFDVFDRLAYDEPKLLGASDRQYVVIQYDALGRVSQRSAPTLAASPVLHWSSLQYDLAGRVTQASRPISDSNATLQTEYTYYEGAKTRLVDAEGKQSNAIVSATGAVIRSTDHAGYYQSFDYDAFGNPVRIMDSLGNTLSSATYNVRGMRLTSSDADLGNWTYTPNALGEVASQTDANSQATTFTYDRQSRPLTRVMPEGAGSITSTWSWGQSAAAKNVGKLSSQQITGSGIATYTENFAYDSLGRPSQTQVVEGANSYFVDTTYSTATGFVDTLTYPTSTSSYRLKLQYDYQSGYLLRVKDFNAPTTVFWQANATNPRGQITDEQFQNGLRTTRSFDYVSGTLDYIYTGPGSGSSIQQLTYQWDKVGNLKERKDVNQNLTEVIYYDDLHRFEHSALNGTTNLTLTYNGTGGILSKTGVGTYTYHASKIHAVSSINTGSGTWSYSYDANGNMTSRNGTEILWYANNLPKRIRKTPGSSTDSSEFQYGPSGRRWKHDYRKGSTLYSHVYIGSLLEKVTEGSNVEWKHYIHADGDAVAVYERHSSGTNTTYYLLRDHLGSTDVVANWSGGVLVRESFDAYGRRRGTNWTGNPTATEIDNMNTSTRRGFTFHEHLDSTDLVHMDGRVYDPLIGRFVSADPTVPHPLSTQSFNRYSYAQNNPLSRIDPNGFEDLNIRVWMDDMNNEDAEARYMANILALFEAAMANGGEMPSFSGMSGMQRVQFEMRGFRGANGAVQMFPIASNVQQFGSGFYARIPGTSAEHGGPGYGADGVADMGGVEFAPSRMVWVASSAPSLSNLFGSSAANAAGNRGIIKWEQDPGDPFAATPAFTARFSGSPEELALVTTIVMISVDALPRREVLGAHELQLPGGRKALFDIYSVGPPENPGPGRVAHIGGTNIYYYSPYHYRPSLDVPNVWIKITYPAPVDDD